MYTISCCYLLWQLYYILLHDLCDADHSESYTCLATPLPVCILFSSPQVFYSQTPPPLCEVYIYCSSLSDLAEQQRQVSWRLKVNKEAIHPES